MRVSGEWYRGSWSLWHNSNWRSMFLSFFFLIHCLIAVFHSSLVKLSTPFFRQRPPFLRLLDILVRDQGHMAWGNSVDLILTHMTPLNLPPCPLECFSEPIASDPLQKGDRNLSPPSHVFLLSSGSTYGSHGEERDKPCLCFENDLLASFFVLLFYSPNPPR